MLDTALKWAAQHWLEIGSFLATCAALYYAHLAYRASMRGLDHAKLAELNALRIQAKAGLNDARQSQVSLELACQVQRANWASHERKQRMIMRPAMGMFAQSPISRVEHEGRQFLAQLSTAAESVDKMNLQDLETLLQQAKTTALQIQALAGKLESPT